MASRSSASDVPLVGTFTIAVIVGVGAPGHTTRAG
jgi:hypothetical protein